jgi:hypothetical protein
MRYMLLIYSKETEVAALEAGDMAAMRAAHWSVMNETSQRGIFRGAEPLKPTSTATTVRVLDGKHLITDGPFAETKEQLAGYYILDCNDLDEAISWASKIPTGCKGGYGSVEIRPIHPVPQPNDPAFAAMKPSDICPGGASKP